MKQTILSILLLTASAVYAESPNQLVYETSEAALVAGSVVNMVQSFQPYNRTTQVQNPQTCSMFMNYANLPPQTCAPTFFTVHDTVHPAPIGRTIGVSVGTAAAIVAEHFIIRRFPKSKRWLSIVNFGAGGAVAYQGYR